MEKTGDVAAIRGERQKVYGDPQEMHDNIARAWTAQLRARYGPGAPELDAQMAELLLAGFKVVRASRPVPDAAPKVDVAPFLKRLREAHTGAPWEDTEMATRVLEDYAAAKAKVCPRQNYLDSFPDATNYLDFAREAVLEEDRNSFTIHFHPAGAPVQLSPREFSISGRFVPAGEPASRLLADHAFVACDMGRRGQRGRCSRPAACHFGACRIDPALHLNARVSGPVDQADGGGARG